MENGEYIFDTAAKKLVYALMRITPDMKIADKNSAARKYTFLPRVGADIRNFCGEYAQKLTNVQNGLKKAAVIPFRPNGKTLYAAVIKEENGCLLMIFHPLLIFVGTHTEQELEKAVAACAEKLRLSASIPEKEKPSFPSSNKYLLSRCFMRSRIDGKKAMKYLEEATTFLNFGKNLHIVIPDEKSIPSVSVEYSKLLYAFAEIVSFASSLSSTPNITATVSFRPDFMAVVALGNSEHRMTSARKLYFDIFTAIMHCMGIGAKILKNREKSFEVAISIPYEASRKLRGRNTVSPEALERMFVAVLEFYGSLDN